MRFVALVFFALGFFVEEAIWGLLNATGADQNTNRVLIPFNHMCKPTPL